MIIIITITISSYYYFPMISVCFSVTFHDAQCLALGGEGVALHALRGGDFAAGIGGFGGDDP